MSGNPCHSELGNGGESKGDVSARRGGSGSFEGASLNSSTYALNNLPKKLLGSVGELAGVSFGSWAGWAGGCWAGCWANTPLARATTIAILTTSINGRRRMRCAPCMRLNVAVDM